LIAEKTGVPVAQITNVYIWGNHSATQYPDIDNAKVNGKRLRDVVSDRDWLETQFPKRVRKRGAEIIEVMGKSSASSAANAICDHMHDWWYGT